MRRAAILDFHMLKPSYRELSRAPTASVPAAMRFHCILCARDLECCNFFVRLGGGHSNLVMPRVPCSDDFLWCLGPRYGPGRKITAQESARQINDIWIKFLSCSTGKSIVCVRLTAACRRSVYIMHGSTPGAGWGAEERDGPGACGTGWRARGAAWTPRQRVFALPTLLVFVAVPMEHRGRRGCRVSWKPTSDSPNRGCPLPDCLHEAPG
jgi:hypothetical protein